VLKLLEPNNLRRRALYTHPVGAATKARFCEAYEHHPPYSCTKEEKKPFSENLSLAFGFSELVYMGIIFVVILVLRKCTSPPDTEKKTGRLEAVNAAAVNMDVDPSFEVFDGFDAEDGVNNEPAGEKKRQKKKTQQASPTSHGGIAL
jgi:hypothetical protein